MAVRKFKSNKNNSLNSKPQGKSTIQINRKEKGLVLLDQTVIRKQTLGECHKTLKKIDKAKQEIEQYEKVDKPAYEKWIQENFGELITRIRMHSQEIQEKRALIEEIQEEAFFQRITFIEAFKIIKYRKAHPEEFEKSKAKENEKKENFWEKIPEDDDDDVFKEDLNDFFKKFNMNEDEFESFRRGFRNGENDKDRNFDVRLKERYRLIVQKLHPDKNKKATPMEQELWFEAQEAYKKKDLDKLDFIIALYNIRFGFIGIDSTIFDLKFANSKLEKSLKEFSQVIRRAKNEPSWSFLKLKPTKLDSLKREAAKEFRDYEKNTNTELREINNILDKWERGATAMGNKNYPKSSQRQREEDFLNFYVNF